MRKLIIIGLILQIGINSFGQEYDSIALQYSKTITAEELKAHLKIIASDEYEGRETGKKGQKMAMNYLINEFKSLGIEDYENKSYNQSFPLIEQEPKGIELTIGNEELQLNKDFTISPSIIKKIRISGEIVFAGYGIEEDNYNDYEKIEVKNKAVFIWNGEPEGQQLKEEWETKKKIEHAREKGAIAIFVYNESLEENIIKYEHYFKKPKLTLVEEFKELAPVIALPKKQTDYILKYAKTSIKKLNKKGLKKVKPMSLPFKLNIDKPTQKYTGENVLAYIPGTEKEEEVLVITAHYDHIGKEGDKIFNGADDDGTGTVALLELAEAFQSAIKNGYEPKRSLLIMPVSGEEKGLLGSKYYTNNPIFPLENTVANLNIDMIGRYDKNHEEGEDYVYLIGSDRLSNDLHNLSEKVNKLYMGINLDYTFNDENDPNQFYYRSDHYNFAKNNIPVIFYFSGVHEDYHKATDTVEKIDYEKTERITRLVFLTAWHILNREERIKLE